MILTADSGSTKTDWKLTTEGSNETLFSTQGINPFHMSENTVEDIIRNELIPCIEKNAGISDIVEIHFYGAGCTPAKIPVMERILRSSFPNAGKVEVASDLLGAAKALCGDKEGIACILGTGANSCYYDGKEIIENVSPMGFILGDEGSGAVIGKTFINELYKGLHSDFIPVFEKETGLCQADIIQKVYREPLPNRFLASLSVFINTHKDEQPWIKDMIVDCFRNFFRKNIAHYNRRDLSVNFVGSIAYYYSEQLKESANLEGFRIGRILKSPLIALQAL